MVKETALVTTNQAKQEHRQIKKQSTEEQLI